MFIELKWFEMIVLEELILEVVILREVGIQEGLEVMAEFQEDLREIVVEVMVEILEVRLGIIGNLGTEEDFLEGERVREEEIILE